MNKHKLERLWKWMTEAILNTPIFLPDGRLYQWRFNGFGSGFQQTQLMDSFCNAIMLLTCLSALGVNIDSPIFWARFQGDDFLVAFLERMFQLYGKNFFRQERDQDFTRLAASAVGLAYANCGVSQRFHRLCEFIFNKLVHEKGFEPNWKAIQWMTRSYIFPTMDELKNALFPTIEHLQAMVFTHNPRTKRENNRQWPNPNGKANGFWFLLNV